MAKSGLNEAGLDDDSKAMIYDGLTVAQLARLFRLDVKGIPGKLRGVAPAGHRGQFEIYRVADVAPFLIKWQGDPSERIKRMNHKDLPPLLQTAFWDGQRSRLRYEEEAGELWPVDQITEYLSELFQIIRLTFLTLSDEVERKSVLTPAQRETIRGLADRKMEELRVRVVDLFTKLGEAERNRIDSLEAEAAPSSPEPVEEADDI